MALFAIGDVQGCYDELMRLLERIDFDPEEDHLWFAGDLVARGPKSLEVLRFVRGLGDRAVTVLGNHDLNLLAIARGRNRRKREGTLDPVLAAPDRDELLDWLRHQPLMHHDADRNFAMIHAGLPPQWDIPTALARAREVEAVLRGDDYREFLTSMYGDEPVCWSDELRGIQRLRFITNCLTRLRYCDADGNLALKEKGAPGSQRMPFVPWFQVADRASRDDRILFGHWSTLGVYTHDNTWALDSGCIWGGRLSALRIKRRKPPKLIQVACSPRRG